MLVPGFPGISGLPEILRAAPEDRSSRSAYTFGDRQGLIGFSATNIVFAIDATKFGAYRKDIRAAAL
jgi:hypothetical protein